MFRDISAEFPLLQDSLFDPTNRDAINSYFAGEMKVCELKMVSIWIHSHRKPWQCWRRCRKSLRKKGGPAVAKGWGRRLRGFARQRSLQSFKTCSLTSHPWWTGQWDRRHLCALSLTEISINGTWPLTVSEDLSRGTFWPIQCCRWNPKCKVLWPSTQQIHIGIYRCMALHITGQNQAAFKYVIIFDNMWLTVS